MRKHFVVSNICRKNSYQFIIFKNHQRKILKTIFMIFHKISTKQKGTVFCLVYKLVPIIFIAVFVSNHPQRNILSHCSNEITQKLQHFIMKPYYFLLT